MRLGQMADGSLEAERRPRPWKPEQGSTEFGLCSDVRRRFQAASDCARRRGRDARSDVRVRLFGQSWIEVFEALNAEEAIIVLQARPDVRVVGHCHVNG
jgi:hypothetical protein